MKDYRYIADLVKNTTEPLALTRLGDGEARILNYINDKPSANYSIKKHMGRTLTDAEVLDIRDNLIYAYNNSSIIGLPTHLHKRGKDKYWSGAEAFMRLYAPLSKDIMKCSIDIHSEWLLYNVYQELLYEKDDVYIITCRDVAEGLKKKYNIKRVHQFLISEQWHYDLEKKENKHYPDQFNEAKAWINSLELDKEICLVGAGFVGKIYCTMFRDRGGIGLDIGHIFDNWYGMQTRGCGGKTGVTHEKYKL